MPERRPGTLLRTRDTAGAASVTYPEITDYDIRISTRVADVLSMAARNDPVFLKDPEKQETIINELADDGDALSLRPNVVLDKIAAVGGAGAAIRVTGSAINMLEDIGSLNGDREAVGIELRMIKDELRRSFRLSKAEQVHTSELENSSE